MLEGASVGKLGRGEGIRAGSLSGVWGSVEFWPLRWGSFGLSGKYRKMVCEVFGGSALVMYLDEEAEP